LAEDHIVDLTEVRTRGASVSPAAAQPGSPSAAASLLRPAVPKTPTSQFRVYDVSSSDDAASSDDAGSPRAARGTRGVRGRGDSDTEKEDEAGDHGERALEDDDDEEEAGAEEDSFDFDSPPRRQPAARPSAATPQPNATAKRAAGVGAVPQTPRQFRAGRDASACAWLAHFDAQVFGGQLAGRVDLKWSSTLRSTAGLCRMMSVKHPANKAAAATTERRAVVELAGKVRARLFASPSALVRSAARISPSPLPLSAGG
jgi:hypothetical protein